MRSSSTQVSNDPTFFSGYGQESRQSRPANSGFLPQMSENTQMYQQRRMSAPAGNRIGGYGTTGNNGAQQRYNPYSQNENQHMSLADVLGTDMNDFQPAEPRSSQPITNTRVGETANDVQFGREADPYIRNTRYNFPTPIEGDFARAMSRIAGNCTSASASGMSVQNSNLQKDLFDQVQMALAVQMGINGPQLVKQRALMNVLTSEPARGDMQQILQSRAEIYGDLLEPKWFSPNTDLGAKLKTIQDRIKARAMLAGAPLLVAQISALELRKTMLQRETQTVESRNPHNRPAGTEIATESATSGDPQVV